MYRQTSLAAREQDFYDRAAEEVWGTEDQQTFRGNQDADLDFVWAWRCSHHSGEKMIAKNFKNSASNVKFYILIRNSQKFYCMRSKLSNKTTFSDVFINFFYKNLNNKMYVIAVNIIMNKMIK